MYYYAFICDLGIHEKADELPILLILLVRASPLDGTATTCVLCCTDHWYIISLLVGVLQENCENQLCIPGTISVIL